MLTSLLFTLCSLTVKFTLWMAKLGQFCVFPPLWGRGECCICLLLAMLTPGVPHTQYVYMCICIYVFTFIRAACGYCYATLVSPKRALLYCCLYTLYAPNKYLQSNPVCYLVQANPGPLCSSRSRYERAPPLHIPRLHIECIYCATYILCAYRSFSFSFRIPSPPCARCQWLQ